LSARCRRVRETQTGTPVQRDEVAQRGRLLPVSRTIRKPVSGQNPPSEEPVSWEVGRVLMPVLQHHPITDGEERHATVARCDRTESPGSSHPRAAIELVNRKGVRPRAGAASVLDSNERDGSNWWPEPRRAVAPDDVADSYWIVRARRRRRRQCQHHTKSGDRCAGEEGNCSQWTGHLSVRRARSSRT
jgi:hypothetical protein